MMIEQIKLEKRYNELALEITYYRHKYIELQNTYSPDSAILIMNLRGINSTLVSLKNEICATRDKINHLKNQPTIGKKNKKKLLQAI